MAPINQSFDDLPGANWKRFGETEFRFGAATNELVHTWLVDTLRPLNLTARFLDKILASAHLALDRSDPSADGQKCDHVHVLIFTQAEISTNGQSWGFFRVEKKRYPQAENPNLDHAIAFYLYLEGN